MHKYLTFILLLFCYACAENQSATTTNSNAYAQNFSIEKTAEGTVLAVKNPWPNSTLQYRYLLLSPNTQAPKDSSSYTQIIRKPLSRIVVTATPQVTALELLGQVEAIVGFPQPQFVSNAHFRNSLEQNKIAAIGNNQQLDVERILQLKPDVFFGFGVSDNHNALEQLKKAGIPVLWIADWTERHPLGRAEWIRFFAPFFQKENLADSLFKTIASEYNSLQKQLDTLKTRPTVMAGVIYQDVWYLPGGGSYLGQLFKDAKADYLWKDTEITGSISSSAEQVLLKAQNADFWFAPAHYTSYPQLKNDRNLYQRFEAFAHQKIYTYNKSLGPTGGTLFFETGPYQPHLLLKDIVYWIHPGVIDAYTPYYFKPLDDE